MSSGSGAAPTRARWTRFAALGASVLVMGLFATAGRTSPQPVAKVPLPILDVHLHASGLSGYSNPDGTVPENCAGDQLIEYPGVDPRQPITLEAVVDCAEPILAPASDAELLRQTIEILERRNIWAITSGDPERLSRWLEAAPERILPATDFGEEGGRLRDLAELRRLHSEGRFVAFSEIAPQYAGLPPAHESLEPYFALAEELDVPVGLHLGEGPPGGAHVLGMLGATGEPSSYRVAAGRPLLLEEVLIRHPRLRIWVMHFGSPFLEEMIAILYSHPQVYVDVAQNNWGFPRAVFHRHLRRLVEAGFGKRILFGSDSMAWPRTIEIAIESIESADFLSEEQKRDILYGNAARFLRLSEAAIARHHAGR